MPSDLFSLAPTAEMLRLARMRRLRLARSPFSEDPNADTEVQGGGAARITALDMKILKESFERSKIERITHQIRMAMDKYAGELAAGLDAASFKRPEMRELLTKLANLSKFSKDDIMMIPHLLDKDFLPKSLGLLLTTFLANHAAKYVKNTPTPKAPAPPAGKAKGLDEGDFWSKPTWNQEVEPPKAPGSKAQTKPRGTRYQAPQGV